MRRGTSILGRGGLSGLEKGNSSGLIIDAAAAAMDEGMETCSGDILGDEEEVIVFTNVMVLVTY